MAVDMAHPDSLRYRRGFEPPEWQWSAESAMCNAPTLEPVDFSSLSSRLGGWWEREEAGTTRDELVGFVPVRRDGLAYDASLYDAADPDALLTRRRDLPLGPFAWTMPDLSLLEVFYPAAEVLEMTASTMLLKWREIGYTAGDLPVYQRAAYRLDEDGLTIEWGTFADAPEVVPQPVLEAGEPCDDNNVICYEHEEFGAF